MFIPLYNVHVWCRADYEALVVKASGLAAGKGVVVAKTRQEACNAVHDILGVGIVILLLLLIGTVRNEKI